MFKVVTKEYDAFYMRQAQAKGKALETPESNAIIGEWIRHKLGVPDGTYITKQMLEQYGKTKVLFKGMKMVYILWNTNSGIKE